MPLVLKNDTYSIFNSLGDFITLYSGAHPEAQEGYGYIANIAYPATMYIPDVDNPVATDKPTSLVTLDKTTLIADGVDFITISSIAPDSTILLESSANGVYLEEPLDSPTDYLTVDAPGDYDITIESFPYLPFTATITGVIA